MSEISVDKNKIIFVAFSGIFSGQHYLKKIRFPAHTHIQIFLFSSFTKWYLMSQLLEKKLAFSLPPTTILVVKWVFNTFAKLGK